MRAYRADAAGNRFVLIDGIAGQAPRDPAALAQRLCTDTAAGSFRPDGLLLCLAGGDSADVRMVLYNADGSRLPRDDAQQCCRCQQGESPGGGQVERSFKPHKYSASGKNQGQSRCQSPPCIDREPPST